MDNRFRLAQLPIAGLRSDGIEMYDLLVRMLDEQGNSVLPSEFLPAAERNKMMKNIDRWVIKNAVKFCEKLGSGPRVRTAVQAVDPGSQAPSAGWTRSLPTSDFDCSRLVMQIPEREAAKHIKHVQKIVKQLRKMGIGFALEHYGVDREKFQILDILQPDYIKIDGELMHALMTDTERATQRRGDR